MNIAVVIINWNQASDTLSCVRMLRDWSLDAAQIWVVDNASAADDRLLLRQAQSDANILYSDTNAGFAGGNNLALAQITQRDYAAVLLLNNDATLDRAAAQHMLDVICNDPTVGIVGALLFDADAPDKLLAAGGRDIARHVSSHIMEPLAAGQLRECEHVPGTCAMLSMRALREVGSLDEAYFFGGEIAAWCQSARQRSYRCVVDGSARALHAVRRSSQIRQSLHAYYVIRNRFLFVRQFHPDQQLKLFLKWTLTGSMMAAQARLQRNMPRARALWLGVLDGWQGRYGGQNARVTRGAVQ